MDENNNVDIEEMIEAQEPLGCAEFLGKLAEVAAMAKEQLRLNKPYSMIIEMHGMDMGDGIVNTGLESIDIGKFSSFNGRGKYDHVDPMDVGDTTRYQFSFEDLRAAFKELGIDRVWNHGGNLDMDFSLEQLDKLIETHMPKRETEVAFSAGGIGEALKRSGLPEMPVADMNTQIINAAKGINTPDLDRNQDKGEVNI